METPKALGRALAVDDEPADLEAIGQALASAGYEVVTASDAPTAMQIFRSQGGVDLLVTDVAMSPINGCDLAAELVRLKPNLRVVFVSAYSGAQSFRYEGAAIADFALVSKPIDREDLIAKVQPGR